jgi:hypothetical protein
MVEYLDVHHTKWFIIPYNPIYKWGSSIYITSEILVLQLSCSKCAEEDGAESLHGIHPTQCVFNDLTDQTRHAFCQSALSTLSGCLGNERWK